MTNSEWAAWASALGGLGAIAAAVWVAIHQSRRADEIEDRAEAAQAARRADMIDEAQAVAAQIVRLLENCAEKMLPNGEGGWTYAYDDYQRAIEIECDRLLELQQFAQMEVGLYLDLSRIARVSRIERRGAHISQAMAGLSASRQARETEKLAGELDRRR